LTLGIKEKRHKILERGEINWEGFATNWKFYNCTIVNPPKHFVSTIKTKKRQTLDAREVSFWSFSARAATSEKLKQQGAKKLNSRSSHRFQSVTANHYNS